MSFLSGIGSSTPHYSPSPQPLSQSPNAPLREDPLPSSSNNSLNLNSSENINPALAWTDSILQARLLASPPIYTCQPPEKKRAAIVAWAINQLQIQGRPNAQSLLEAIDTLTDYFDEANGFETSIRNRARMSFLLKYSDIYPYDHSCVSADPYFNASFMNNSGVRAIASEGPMASSCYNFWNMVWEQTPSLIVNLTELTESSGAKLLVKCCKYWPQNRQEMLVLISPSQENEKFTVSLKSKNIIASIPGFDKENCDPTDKQYTIEYQLELTKGEKIKKITLLHYRNLKDMSAPTEENDIAAFVHLIKLIREKTAQEQESCPLLHCSAGVGRTGMVLGCLYFLDLLSKNHLPNGLDPTAQTLINAAKQKKDLSPNLTHPAIATFLVQMRAERAYMVQKPCQFELIAWFINYVSQHPKEFEC